jgi:hypothetical protein
MKSRFVRHAGKHHHWTRAGFAGRNKKFRRKRMCDIDYVSIGEVQDANALARYIEQRTGAPWASIKDMSILRKKCKEFFEHYPHCDWTTLCHVADWCQRKRKRYSHVWKVVDAFRYAYEDGALPEVDQGYRNRNLEREIADALEQETDRLWRMRLIGTRGIDARKEVLQSWRMKREPQLVGL